MNCIGIYIHVPFCIKKCNYCDFCSFTSLNKEIFYEYTEELCRRMKDFASSKENKIRVKTVYFGGGTPTLLPTECFERLLSTLYECFSVDYDAEITVECNPASIDLERLCDIRRLGINRLSIGLQSSNDNELRILGRLHTFKDFCDIYSDARKAGFDNISVDVMYGIPEQTADSLDKTLKEVCRLSTEHISVYGLKIEEGTQFHKAKNLLLLPDEDTEYEMYCRCVELLNENGYERYEISNFARKGRESQHNLRYWTLKDYVGFGVAAHSCFEGQRFGNSRDIKAFLEGKDITEERYDISKDERLKEYVMLGLRLENGLDLIEYYDISGRPFKEDFPMAERFMAAGFLKEKDGRIAFSTKGFFVSNTILSQMLSFG